MKVTISHDGKSVDTTIGEIKKLTDRTNRKAHTMTGMPKLPTFEGRLPDGQTLKIGGSHELDVALWDAHHLEDVVYAIIALRVQKVGHEIDKDGAITRVETLNGTRLALLEQEEGEKLLHEKLAAAGITLV